MIHAEKFEIHYFLQSDSHSMDVLIRNKCEKEFLAIAYEIISQLNLDLILEAEAWNEGGLRDKWKALSITNKIATAGIATTILMGILGIIFTRNELQDAKDCLEIEKLRKELSFKVIRQDVIDTCAALIQKSPKIQTRRSNFYKNLQQNEKVTQVGFSKLDKANKRIIPEVIISREDFPGFILPSNKLPDECVENAYIEIVAPVLREGKTKWKGIYGNEPISFKMKDAMFNNQVLTKQISFKNSDAINCVLNIQREINELGETIIKNYIVETVIEKIENNIVMETASGRKYRYNKKQALAQGNLFIHSNGP